MASPKREGRCGGRPLASAHPRQRRSTGSIVACQLSAAIDEQVQKLSQQLGKEREKSKVLLNRAQEAESIAVWLKEELDLSATGERSDDPGATPPGPPQTRPRPGEAPRSATCDEDEEDQNVFTMFIEQNFRLREELSQEKQKFSDLRRETLAHAERLCADAGASRRPQEEVARLREENAQLREDLRLAGQREEGLAHENAALSATVADFESGSDKKRKEMEVLVQTMSLQLLKVERELSECLGDFSELVDPFIRSALTVSMRLCIACQKLDAAAPKSRKLPHLCDPESGDIRMKFESVLGILSYVLGVIEPPGELCDVDFAVMGAPARVMALAN